MSFVGINLFSSTEVTKMADLTLKKKEFDSYTSASLQVWIKSPNAVTSHLTGLNRT